MSIYIGKFNSKFDEKIDQIKERICIGNDKYYNGIKVGDYIFPSREGKIAELWKVAKFEDREFNREIVNTAFFEKVKSFEPILNLEQFTSFKDFDLDMNLLNKAMKPTSGTGFYKIEYEKDSKEIENVDIRNERRKFYMALKESKVDLKDKDILVKIDNTENTKVEGFFEFLNGELKENKTLANLYESKNKERYTLKELFDFSGQSKDNAKNKRSFLKKVLEALEEKGIMEIEKPMHIYDNIIVGRLVTNAGKKVKEEIDEEWEEKIFEEREEYDLEDYIIKDEIENIYNFIRAEGYEYDMGLVKNLYASIKTKPFVILSGISGTGKSKIVELFAKALGATTKNNRFKLIPVKPDWSDSSDILGYRNIEGEFIVGTISEICYKAMLNPKLPYFICLDEMNLARVEYYFSDILSLIETRRNEEGRIVTNNVLSRDMIGTDFEAIDKYGDIFIPDNLYIIGTVNMDETTFQFSKKVLDRANTIEFNKVNLGYDFDFSVKETIKKEYKNKFLKAEFINLKDCIEYKDTINKIVERLIEINNILEEYNQHFAYRVRDEISFYVIYMIKDDLMSFDKAMDKVVLQKILPKISGSNDEVLELLCRIFNLLSDVKIENIEEIDIEKVHNLKENLGTYKESNEKILYMIRRYLKDGFTTFWR